MENEPRPPKGHQEFVNRFPKLQLAWESIAKGQAVDDRPTL